MTTHSGQACVTTAAWSSALGCVEGRLNLFSCPAATALADVWTGTPQADLLGVCACVVAQDDSKMRELALALEKTNKAVVSRRGELETEVVETQAAQTQLDKAAEDFR